MPRIDESKPFLAVNIVVLTVSDTRTSEDDTSGDRLESMILADNHKVVAREIVKDDRAVIAEKLRSYAQGPEIDVIITTGGTGVTGRDVTPDAFKDVMDKEIEGFGELFRWVSFDKVGTSTMQSRAIGGVLNGTYIFALPGSPSACKDGWMEILRYQLDVRHRPCNLVELMPRLKEHL